MISSLSIKLLYYLRFPDLYLLYKIGPPTTILFLTILNLYILTIHSLIYPTYKPYFGGGQRNPAGRPAPAAPTLDGKGAKLCNIRTIYLGVPTIYPNAWVSPLCTSILEWHYYTWSTLGCLYYIILHLGFIVIFSIAFGLASYTWVSLYQSLMLV